MYSFPSPHINTQKWYMLVLNNLRMEVNGKLFQNIKCYLLSSFNIPFKRPQRGLFLPTALLISHINFLLWTTKLYSLTVGSKKNLTRWWTRNPFPIFQAPHNFEVIHYYLIITIHKLGLNHRFPLKSHLPVLGMTSLSLTPGISMHNLSLKRRSYHLSHPLPLHPELIHGVIEKREFLLDDDLLISQKIPNLLINQDVTISLAFSVALIIVMGGWGGKKRGKNVGEMEWWVKEN